MIPLGRCPLNYHHKNSSIPQNLAHRLHVAQQSSFFVFVRTLCGAPQLLELFPGVCIVFERSEYVESIRSVGSRGCPIILVTQYDLGFVGERHPSLCEGGMKGVFLGNTKSNNDHLGQRGRRSELLK